MALIFIAWSGLDYFFHHVILMGEYQATAALWRPMADMKMELMYLTTFLAALFFVGLYCQSVRPKTLCNGVKFGLLLGFLIGIPMGIGTFSYMPITQKIAIVWLFGTLVNYTVAGAIVGLLVKSEMKTACCHHDHGHDKTHGNCHEKGHDKHDEKHQGHCHDKGHNKAQHDKKGCC